MLHFTVIAEFALIGQVEFAYRFLLIFFTCWHHYLILILYQSLLLSCLVINYYNACQKSAPHHIFTHILRFYFAYLCQVYLSLFFYSNLQSRQLFSTPMKATAPKTIKLGQVSFQTSFHRPILSKTKSIHHTASIAIMQNLTAQEQGLIIEPTRKHGYSYSQSDSDCIIRSGTERIPIFEDYKKELSNKLQGNSGVYGPERLDQRLEKDKKSMDTNYILNNTIFMRRNQSPKQKYENMNKNKSKLYSNSIFEPSPSPEQNNIHNKTNFNKIKHLLAHKKHTKQQQKIRKKRNSCSLPLINRSTTAISQNCPKIDKNFTAKIHSLAAEVQKLSLVNILRQENLAIHERKNSKMVMVKIPRGRRQSTVHLRAQTEIKKEPFLDVFQQERKKMAQKYEKILKERYSQLMNICDKNQIALPNSNNSNKIP